MGVNDAHTPILPYSSAMASFRNTNNSRNCSVVISVIHPSLVPTMLSASAFLRSIIASIFSSNVPAHKYL